MVDVSIRYWAGAAAAAGVDGETIAAPSVAAALTSARTAHEGRLDGVLAVSSILVDGRATRGEALEAPLTGPVSVEVLPPFAGG
ncbi:MoaD/ThiS family protein [Mariniluteicoccus flavus]